MQAAEEEQLQQLTESENAEATGQSTHQVWVAEDADDDDSSSQSSEHIPVATVHNDQGDEQHQQLDEQQQGRATGSDEETPLSRAMARAVKEFEDAAAAAEPGESVQQQLQHQPQPFTVARQETPAPKQSAPPARQPAYDDSEGSGTFGIEYRPFKQEQTYIVPAGPAFEDEEEFTKELVSSSIVAATAGNSSEAEGNSDDEFEVDVGTPAAAAVATTVVSAAPRAATASATAALPVVSVENDGETNKPAAVNEALATPAPAAPQSLAEQARSALQAIASIYESGLGDVGVRELEAVEKRATSDVAALDVGKVSIIIEEGEEDEIEDEGEDGDAEKQQQLQQQRQLEEEWQQPGIASQYEALPDQIPGVQPTAASEFREIAYSDALQWVRGTDLAIYQDNIVVEAPGGFMQRMLIPKLRFPNCEAELELPFLIGCVSYDPAIQQHKAVLETIYRALTNSTDPVPDLGPHWEQIGFQGLDPATDLNRTMGFLSLLQMLSFLEEDPALAAQLYRLSLISNRPVSIGRDSSWPFLCVSIGLTVDSIRVLRSGKLHHECNRQQQILPVLNELHRAMFFRLYLLLQLHEISHISLRLQQLRKEVMAKPSKVLHQYRNRARGATDTPASSDPRRSNKDIVEAFSALEAEDYPTEAEQATSSKWFGHSKADCFRVK